MADPSAARALSRDERLAWVRLLRSERVGPITFRRLLERYGSASRAIEALPDLARKGGAKGIKVCAKADAERELAAVEAMGARLIALTEPEFPPLLAHVEDGPPILCALGHVHLLTKRAVAVVGSRNASLNGRKFAEAIARDLGQGGLMVVSGLARGIDAAAHAGALSTGTAAVVAGGVDVIYPRENADLYHAIVEQGVVVSEMPLGTEPQASHFPRRNRIISGMSRGVVVIEAGDRSGSLITARVALEQGREVFAVPGPPQDPRSRGANRLIRDGATLTENANDVFEALNALFRQPLSAPKPFYSNDKAPDPSDPAEIERARSAVLDLLSPTATAVDELIRHGQSPQSVVAQVLLELELAGRLERHPGNRVSLIA